MKLCQTALAALSALLIPLGAAAQPAQDAAEIDAPIEAEQIAIGAPDARMALMVWRSAESGKMRPLVVISHGTGAGPLAHVDTAEALAVAGFVVAAPMHRGDNFQDDSNVGRPDWMASRFRDVSATIDYMMSQWPGRSLLDQHRVGIFGFSAGGTTALISAGGALDLERIAPHCAAQREFVCNLVVPQQGPPPPPPPVRTHDERIAAAVVAAPGLGFAFEPSGLTRVTIPVQLWSGAADQTVPYATNAGAVRRLLPGPVEFHDVENAVHLSFLAPCSPEMPPQLCVDNPGFDRAAFHREFNNSVVAFFGATLGGGESERQ